MRNLFAVSALTLSFMMAACGGSTPEPVTPEEPSTEMPEAPTETEAPMTEEPAMTEEPKDIVTVAVESGKFTKLVEAVKAAGLVETLQGEGPFTVFAPTDAAFEAVADTTADLTPEQLADVLKFHVVSGKVMAADVAAGDVPTLLDGKSLTLKVEGEQVMLAGKNEATVVQTDIEASNGVIHVIDAVILPPQ